MLLTILVLFFIIFILIIPVDVVFTFNNLENKKSDVVINLLFGLIHFQLFPKKQKEKKAEAIPIKTPKKKKRFSSGNILKLAIDEKFIGKLTVFLKRILRSIKFKIDNIYIRLGLDDPADTGMLWGLVGPSSALLKYYCQNNVLIEPEFQDSALDIDTKGKVSIIPLEIVTISLVFIFSPTTVKAFWLSFAGGTE